jgi:hypothetical protein
LLSRSSRDAELDHEVRASSEGDRAWPRTPPRRPASALRFARPRRSSAKPPRQARTPGVKARVIRTLGAQFSFGSAHSRRILCRLCTKCAHENGDLAASCQRFAFRNVHSRDAPGAKDRDLDGRGALDRASDKTSRGPDSELFIHRTAHSRRVLCRTRSSRAEPSCRFSRPHARFLIQQCELSRLSWSPRPRFRRNGSPRQST